MDMIRDEKIITETPTNPEIEKLVSGTVNFI